MKERQRGEGSIKPKEQMKLQQEKVVSNSPVSPVEQKTPSPEEGEEDRFEITEREKYLLDIMAHVIAQDYLPSLGGQHDSYSKRSMERILRSGINRSTKIIPSEEAL